MELRLKRTPRPDLLVRVGPVIEKTGLFKLPLGDPWLEAEERETYPRLIADVVIPALQAAKACYLFPPKQGVAQEVAEFFAPASRRGLFLLKEDGRDQIGKAKEFWNFDSEKRGEICFVLPVASASTDRVYAGAYLPSGFLNVGSVLSRRALDFARKTVGEGEVLSAWLAEVGSDKRLFVFGPPSAIRAEWLRALAVAKCDPRMKAEYFAEAE